MHNVSWDSITVHLVLVHLKAILNALLETHGIQQTNGGHGPFIVQTDFTRAGSGVEQTNPCVGFGFQDNHPLWAKPRVTLAGDDTCTNCHAPLSTLGAVQLPAAQLDLSDGASDLNGDHFKAYRELLSGDNEQELVGGVLADRLVQTGVDPVTGDPVFSPVPVSASLSTAGANNSTRFFSRFAPGGTHAGRLSAAELRLISEWVDIGAQYYNDPFQAPLN